MPQVRECLIFIQKLHKKQKKNNVEMLTLATPDPDLVTGEGFGIPDLLWTTWIPMEARAGERMT